MATKAQRTTVGVFVLTGAAIIIIGAAVMTGLSASPKIPYWMEFENSVLGLSVGSTVEYLGVSVGQVREIGVTRDNRIRVDIEVDSSKVTLHEGATAKLVMSSFATGMLYVSLEGGDPSKPQLPAHYQIPTSTSFTEEVFQQIAGLQENLGAIIEDIRQGLSGLEEEELTELIRNVDKTVADMDTLIIEATDTVVVVREDLQETITEGRGLITDGRTLAQNLDRTATNANELVTEVRTKIEGLDLENAGEEISELLDSLNVVAKRLEESLDTINAAADTAAHEIDNVEYNLRSTLKTTRETLDSIRALTDYLRQDPASVLRGPGRPEDPR